MPRPALSEAEIEAFRRKAIRAATRLFAEQGYEAVTMRAIAEKLGTSAMAPYRYFANKAEIFAMVRSEATRAWCDRQLAELSVPGSALERLVRARAAYVRFALENPDQYQIIFDARAEPEDRYPELAAQNQRAVQLMLELGRLAIESGLYRGDPTTVAHLLWAHVHGLVSLQLAGKLKAGRSLEQLLEATSVAALEAAGRVPPAKARRKRASSR